MANKTVCDFCLSEGKGLLNRPEKIRGGHHICKSCRNILKKYDLPVAFDLFQQLVTAQQNMRNMIMDAYLEAHTAEDAMARFFPDPQGIKLHEGEYCINCVDASLMVDTELIPDQKAPGDIADIEKKNISDVPDAKDTKNNLRITGKLVETQVAIYFLSENFINCHRPGFLKRSADTDRIVIDTGKKHFTYRVKHADIFYLRESFYRKVYAALNNKKKHLIYITGDDEVTITPGVYEIGRSLRAGKYRVVPVHNKGLHMKDPMGRVKDYYESDEYIEVKEGGVLECTGEYHLKFVGEQ